MQWSPAFAGRQPAEADPSMIQRAIARGPAVFRSESVVMVATKVVPRTSQVSLGEFVLEFNGS